VSTRVSGEWAAEVGRRPVEMAECRGGGRAYGCVEELGDSRWRIGGESEASRVAMFKP
jgi:hypothetical protein